MEPLSPFPWLAVAAIFALIVLNGLFALSELAIVSAPPQPGRRRSWSPTTATAP